jgi:hypothetical protein
MHTKDLVDLLNAQSMVNMMTSILNPNHNMQLSFNKIEIIGAKNQSRKYIDKKPSHLVMGNQLNQPEEK